MVGQICCEGIDESGILPKAEYAMTVGHCLKQQGFWGAVSPPVGPGQSTVPKNGSKTAFLVHFHMCAAYKFKRKIHLN